MKKIQLILLSTGFSSLIFAQTHLSQSAFQPKAELIENQNPEYFGLVSEPVDVDYSNYQTTSNSKIAYPAVFDMRLTGGITSVKNQGACGSCWLFPSMGAVESRWKRLGMGDFDLSEDNLKHCHNFSYQPCQGGNRLMATAYFTRGKGPISEAQDPYAANSPTGCPVGLTPVANVTEAWFLPNRNITEIKHALYNYGAVYNTFFWDSKYYNSAQRVYCMTRDTSAANNHAVLIVGWNDTITTTLGKGAWIIKNSWGAGWGDKGFFYLSYSDLNGSQDPTIWVNRTDYNAKQIFHGYDDLGWNSSIGGAKTSYGVVKFTASTNQILKQIATYAVAPNTSISAEIYSNFSGSTFSGLIGTVPAKTGLYAGYYTLDLTNPINITTGSTFYVKYKIVNSTTYNPLAVESKITSYTNNAIIETGKCWTSANGTSWTAIGANTSQKYDLCLKVIAEESCDFLKSTVTQTLTNLCSGQTTTLTATSNVTGVSYQWQMSTNNGATWTNVVNGTKYSGSQTANLKISSVVILFDNYKFRCNVSSSCNSVYSNNSTLRVTSSPVVAINPTDITIPSNGAATFYVEVSNPSNCMYQWQVNTTGTTWTNLVDNTNILGSTTNEIYVSANAGYSNKRFRCRLKSSCSSTYQYSYGALLTIGSSIGGGGSSTGANTFKLSNTDETESSIEDKNITDFVMYPNPANELIQIDYNLFTTTKVEITVYDLLGQVVGSVVNNELEAGEHTSEMITSDYKNGTYLVVLMMQDETGKVSRNHKRLVITH